jgi:hypothetical protein
MGAGYGFWTPEYLHQAATQRWRDFHPDKPFTRAEVVDVNQKLYIRILAADGKVIGVYLALRNGMLKGLRTWPPMVATAPANYPKLAAKTR